MYTISRSRIINNLDLLLLVVEVLDSELIEDLLMSLTSTFLVSSTEKVIYSRITSIRLSNPIREMYKKGLLCPSLVFRTLTTLFQHLASQHLLHLLEKLLLSFIYDLNVENSFINKFLRKYRFYYRKKMNIYRVGKKYYQNDNSINDIAVNYIYLLYLIIIQKDLFFFIDSLYNFSHLNLD